MISREKKYLFLRATFGTRKDAISAFRERFAARHYMSRQDRRNMIALSDTLSRLAATRQEAIERKTAELKGLDKILPLLGDVPVDDWKRRQWEQRHPPSKPRAKPQPGSSVGKARTTVIGVRRTLYWLRRLEKALDALGEVEGKEQLARDLKSQLSRMVVLATENRVFEQPQIYLRID